MNGRRDPDNVEITVGATRVRPGERASVDLPVANLYTNTSLHMPVHVVCGRRRGPTLFVSAAVHGDEINGVEIIRRLLALRALGRLRGTLLAVPVVNVHGFLDRSRYLPDRRDLNRSFPGSPRGSIAARLANTFMKEVVLKADLGVDLHTGALDRSNLPQVRAWIRDDETLRLARAFGAPVVIGGDLRDGSLRACAQEQGIPVLVYEAGEALRFDEVSIRAGLRGILRIMRKIGMLQRRKDGPENRTVVASETTWVRAPASGIVVEKAPLGRMVAKGERLAQVTDPLGTRTEDVTAPLRGMIIGRSNLPLAHEGDALFHLASFDSAARARDAVEEFASIHDPGLGRTVESELMGT
ncbi:MAG: succinylglutamate desuccinylase/aspartoacylase family protein [Gammaproteobacteria bacterium]